MTDAGNVTTADSRCNVCGGRFQHPIYVPDGDITVTSLCHLYRGKGDVYLCEFCGHLQTSAIEGIAEYYDREYKILVDSEEEDQFYEVSDAGAVYRSDHQVRTLLSKLDLPRGARILDYGCAKAATLRKLATIRTDVVPHLFDVSQMYIPFWQTFAREENWAIYEVPAKWRGYFDAVTTFFALEHVANPAASLRDLSLLLKPGGILYGIVPNVFTNWADLVVVDHVNHFSAPSLELALHDAGLEPLEIDDSAHTGAYVFRARRPLLAKAGHAGAEGLQHVIDEARKIAAYWKTLGARIRDFESTLAETSRTAIYGSGFYGTFIAASLRQFSRIECFLDRNPFRQGKQLLDKPIIAPEALDEDFDTIFVGINPASAKKAIADLKWDRRKYQYFFL